MTVIRALCLLAYLVAGAPHAVAVQPDEVLPDPVLEARAREISAELRCLVCQNQSIDDSDAPLARDLRLLVRERLQVGDTESQVREYLVARYGDFILLRPPFRAGTLLLWSTPLVVLFAGAIVAAMRFRWRPARVEHKLSAEEEQEIARILRDSSGTAQGPSRLT